MFNSGKGAVSVMANGRGTEPREPTDTITVINPRALDELISVSEAIDVIDGVMRRLSAGEVDAPQRWQMPVSEYGSLALMPGTVSAWGCYGVKLLSLYENAAQNGLPGHQGIMLLFDRESGRLVSIMEANALTRLRTAAASAVATRALAREDATSLALLGCGEQARWHARMVPLVRPIKEVRVWGRSSVKARRFADEHLQRFERVVIANSAEQAVRGADVICTTTHATRPIIDSSWLEAGQHINLIGASTKAEQEIDGRIVARAGFFVDSRDHALNQAGELIEAIEAGWAGPDDIRGEIGEVLSGQRPGRRTQEEITAYKSLGHIAQDLAIATFIRARSDRSSAVTRAPFFDLPK